MSVSAAVASGLLAAAFVAVLVLLSAIDLRTRLIPNRIVLPAAAAVLAAHIAIAPEHAAEWILAALTAAAVLLVPALLRPDALGMGDVKLALLVGAGIGWQVGNAAVIASLALIPVALGVLLLGGAGARRATLPLGPFIAFGAIAVALFGSAF